MVNTIRITEWNANGLLQNLHKLEISLKNERIDIRLLSETHFTRETFIKMKGYQIYHTIHPSNKASGGTAVIIKDNMKHYEECKYEDEATTVNIKTKNKQYTISAIYYPPRYNLEKRDFTYLFQKLENHFIIGGDFKAKHTH